MIEPQPLFSATPLNSDGSDFNWEIIRNTVLKFPDLPPSVITPASDFSIPDPLWETWEQLIQVITHLKSPQGGWPGHLAQTPETLIPYVIEEAAEVLNSLKTIDLKPQTATASPMPVYPLPSLILMKEFSPILLWYMARSADHVMRLLSGINGKVFQVGRQWSSGMLRLVAILKVETPQIQWMIDLATSQPPPSCLRGSSLLQSTEVDICRSFQTCEQMIENLQKTIQTLTPETRIFTEPIDVDVLVPGGEWEAGYLQLDLGFQFVSRGSSLTSGFAGSASEQLLTVQVVSTSAARVTPETIPHSIASLHPAEAIFGCPVKLISKAVSPSPEMMIKQEAIKAFLERGQNKWSALPASDPVAWDDLLDLTMGADRVSPEILEIVTAASQTLDQLQSMTEGAGVPTLTLTDLTLSLLWQIIKSSYSTMQLIGGVRAQVLQSGYLWQTGLLRLLAQLNIRIGTQTWEIDVATTQVLGGTLPLVSDAIVQSYQSQCCPNPTEAETLVQNIRDELQTHSPELKAWMAGKPIELEHRGWQQGHAQLTWHLEFIADGQPTVY